MEQFANEAGANIDGAINNSVTSITVKNRVNIPSSGTFRARVDNEYLKVTAVSGTTWTIARGDGGTTAASHADNAVITLVVTKEAVDALVTVQSSVTEVGNRRVLNFIGATVADNSGSARVDVTIAAGASIEASWTAPPATGSWTGINMGSGATSGDFAATGSDVILRAKQASGDWGDNVRIQYIGYTAPATLIARVEPFVVGANHQCVGVAFYQTSTVKFAGFRFTKNSDGGMAIDKWTNASTFSANYLSFSVAQLTRWRWLKLADDNTNRIISVSPDGTNWIQIHSVSRTDFLTPNAFCIWADANNNNGTQVYDCALRVSSWSVT